MMALGAVGIQRNCGRLAFSGALSSEKAIAIGLRSGEQAADTAVKRVDS